MGMAVLGFAQNYAVSFDGVNDYITLGSNKFNTVLSGAPAITVEAWIKPTTLRTGTDANRNVILDFPVAATNSQIMMYMRQNGVIRLGGRSNSTDAFQDLVTPTPVITTGTWQHVAGVMDFANKAMYIYVNGLLVASRTTGIVWGSLSFVPGVGGTEVIGVNAALSATQFYHGLMDEIRVWNVVRTQSQILANMDKEFHPAPANLVGYFRLNESSGTTAINTSATINNGTLMGGAFFVTSDNTLPAELSSFTATISAQNYVVLTWISQSETNLAGYYVYRNDSSDLSSAIRVSTMIPAGNSSGQNRYTYQDSESEPGQWYYWLQSRDLDGSEGFHGPVSIMVTSDNGTPDMPWHTELLPIYPNPFNPTTNIRYTLGRKTNVTIRVFNTKGQLVRTMEQGMADPGAYHIVWDGRDNNGNVSPSGIYMIRMTAGEINSSVKAMLMK